MSPARRSPRGDPETQGLRHPGSASDARRRPRRTTFQAAQGDPFHSLPDYLRPGLRLVFIGINPSVYSVERGHYFARVTNRFWPALSRSALSAPIRGALGRTELGPEDDRRLLQFGIGFTDVVKVPSRNAAALRPTDFQVWAPNLLKRLVRVKPRVACFHGITGYRAFTRYALGCERGEWELGAQSIRVATMRLYVVPNPSPANAHFRLDDLVRWYDRLAVFLAAANGMT